MSAAAVVFVCAYVVSGCGGGSTNGSGPPGKAEEGAGFGDGGPEGLVFDRAGNLYASDCQTSRVFRITDSGTVTVVAGTGTYQLSGDGGSAPKANVYCPSGLALDADGNLFIADRANNRVREVDKNGVITTVAGTGKIGVDAGTFSGDGGPALRAHLWEPSGLAFDARGNLFVADRDNNRIRKIGRDGIIATVAGTGKAGFSGDGGPATKAKLNLPENVAVDKGGNIYVSDSGNHRVRRIGADGVITTVWGGPLHKLSNPGGLAFDKPGSLYISDAGDNVVRRIDTNGTITTVAGTGKKGFAGDDGPATNAKLANPVGLAFDSKGNLYIADQANVRVRIVQTDGLITTFVGGD
jgi:trimeric autotransporter adhesin